MTFGQLETKQKSSKPKKLYKLRSQRQGTNASSLGCQGAGTEHISEMLERCSQGLGQRNGREQLEFSIAEKQAETPGRPGGTCGLSIHTGAFWKVPFRGPCPMPLAIWLLGWLLVKPWIWRAGDPKRTSGRDLRPVALVDPGSTYPSPVALVCVTALKLPHIPCTGSQAWGVNCPGFLDRPCPTIWTHVYFSLTCGPGSWQSSVQEATGLFLKQTESYCFLVWKTRKLAWGTHIDFFFN